MSDVQKHKLHNNRYLQLAWNDQLSMVLNCQHYRHLQSDPWSG